MRKFFVFFLSLSVISSLFAGITEAPINRNNFNAKLEKRMRQASKQSKSFARKAKEAEKAGNSEIANIYTACSEANTNIADAIKKYEKAKSRAEAICQGHKELMSYFENYVGHYKKGETIESRVENLNKCSEECITKAVNKKFTASSYKKFAEQLQIMATSLEKYKNSIEAYKTEKAKL